MTRSRPKGVAAEREAAALWDAEGAAVRGLEAGGDHLIVVEALAGSLLEIGVTYGDGGWMLEQLIAALDVTREHAAPAADNGKPTPEAGPASDKQLAYIGKLCDEKAVVRPDEPLTKQQASEVIDSLQAGTYDPDKWS